jgi:hypothetical protein
MHVQGKVYSHPNLGNCCYYSSWQKARNRWRAATGTRELNGRLYHHLALGCSIIFPKIVGIDKSKHREDCENRDERPDELHSHVLQLEPCDFTSNNEPEESFLFGCEVPITAGVTMRAYAAIMWFLIAYCTSLVLLLAFNFFMPATNRPGNEHRSWQTRQTERVLRTSDVVVLKIAPPSLKTSIVGVLCARITPPCFYKSYTLQLTAWGIPANRDISKR